MILSAQNISKSFGGRKIFSDIELSVAAGDRIGFVGINGSGKTTLLNILTGTCECDSGVVSLSQGTDVGYMKQNEIHICGGTIYDEMLGVYSDLLEISKKMREAEDAMSRGEKAEGYAELCECFEKRGGYEMDFRISAILNGMGFSTFDWKNTRTATMSGGEKTRLALAKLLLREPKLLILDEPTNHLDFVTLMWLEERLSSYKGAVIAVSHDRYFLDKTVNRIWEMELGRLTVYRGNYSAYAAQKKTNNELRERHRAEQLREKQRLLEYAARNMVRASTSKSAKSKLKAAERIVVEEAAREDHTRSHIRFVCERASAKDVLTVKNLAIKAGGKILLDNINFELKRGDKIAIIGENGVGKSTLVKTLLGLCERAAGSIEFGQYVSMAYFEQENLNLDVQNRVIDELWRVSPYMSESEARGLLGCMDIRGDDVYKSVGSLSGGERARLALALVMLRRANLLILDEPSNHLDLDTKEKLDEALAAYDGTLIMITHDRYLLNRVPHLIIEMTKEGIHRYRGGFDDYIESRRAEAPEDKKAEESQVTCAKNDRAARAEYRKKVSELEREMARLEAETQKLEHEINLANGDYKRIGELSEKLEQARKELSRVGEEWLESV